MKNPKRSFVLTEVFTMNRFKKFMDMQGIQHFKIEFDGGVSEFDAEVDTLFINREVEALAMMEVTLRLV